MSFDVESRIVHREGGVLVLDKPAGWPSTGRTLDDPRSVHFVLSQTLGRRTWAVHQLDRDTSGLLFFVERKSLVPTWQRRLGHDLTKKTYIAIIHGTLPSRRKSVNAPIGPVDRRRSRYMVRRDGKPARTDFRRVVRHGDFSVVEAVLHTGRTHQIRVHLAHLGLSLVGETLYHDPPCSLHPRHALHAASTSFGDGLQPDHLSAPLPDDLEALRDQLGLRDP